MDQPAQDPRPLLIFDGTNGYVRAWCSYPTMSQHGYQIGGTVGFLKTMKRVIEETHPRHVFVAWEAGGSLRRRAVYSEYKMRRRPEKLNRFYEDDMPETSENWQLQFKSLVRLLACLPVTQIYVEDAEADDVVGYLVNKYSSDQKVIVSSDKDFFQLLDANTRQYDLHKKAIISPDDVRERYGIPAHNFAIAKAICGDASDNIPGVPRVGFKTLVKHVPILLGDPVILQDVGEYAAAHRDSDKVCSAIWDAWPDVTRNWRLVYLGGVAGLSHHQISKIEARLEVGPPEPNRLKYLKILMEIGAGTVDPNEMFRVMQRVKE